MAVQRAHHDVRRAPHPSARLAPAALVFVVAGCLTRSAAVNTAVDAGLDPAHVVDLGDAAVATRAGGPGMQVVLVGQDVDGSWRTTVIAGSDARPGTNTSGSVSGSGLDIDWSTFVFGTAAPDVARVSAGRLPDARGGVVIGGMWVVASTAESVSPEDLTIDFLTDDGVIVESH